MARKMALVPESWLHRNFDKPTAHKSTTPVEVTIHSEKPSTSIVDMLPKAYRTKARMILHYITDNVKIDSNQRVVYSNGVVGSHIIDLLRYFCSAFVKARPVDAPDFEKLLVELGVPSSAYVKRGGERSLTSKWKTYK